MNGNFSEFVPFTVIEKILFGNSLHYSIGELDDCISWTKTGKCLVKNKGIYPAPPDEFNKLASLRIVSIPFIIPLIKGAKIDEGSIEDSSVISKLVAHHGAAAEWLCLMNMDSRCSSNLWCGDSENQCPRPVIAQSIVTSYEMELFVKVLMGASKNSVEYRTVKKLVDNFRTTKQEKFKQDHPEVIEIIPKSIDLDCNSKCSKSVVSSVKSISSGTSTSSVETKVVEKNTRLLSFFQILFCREDSGEELVPRTMSDMVMEITVSSDKIAEQARLTTDTIIALTDEIGTERSYISRCTRFPFCLTLVFLTCFKPISTMARLIQTWSL